MYMQSVVKPLNLHISLARLVAVKNKSALSRSFWHTALQRTLNRKKQNWFLNRAHN